MNLYYSIQIAESFKLVSVVDVKLMCYKEVSRLPWQKEESILANQKLSFKRTFGLQS